MDLKVTMLNEKRQSQKITYYLILYNILKITKF